MTSPEPRRALREEESSAGSASASEESGARSTERDVRLIGHRPRPKR